ncbi:MAG: DNA gyrase inhibitor YacG [Sphingomonas sp.]|nr:DNA gyrase inhibitor YacG [Sphingomonas sp.]
MPTACPICGKPVSPTHKPFCSRGCVDRDLLQWLGEGYRLPAGPATDDEQASKDSIKPGLDSDADDD